MIPGKILGAILALALTSSAYGAVISYSRAFNLGGTLDSDLTGSVSTNLFDFRLLSVPRFDPALGTLQGAAITLDWNYAALITGSDLDTTYEKEFALPFSIESNDTRVNLRLASSATMRLTDPSSSFGQINFPALDGGCSHRIGPYSPYDDYCSFSQDPIILNGLSSLGLGALPLMAFVGLNPLDLAVDLTSNVLGACDSNDAGDLCHVFASASWTGSVDVFYTYAPAPDPSDGGPENGGDTMPVPEPGSLALLATGLAAFSMFRGRNRSPARGERAATGPCVAV